MQVTVTKRADGSVRVGDYTPRHYSTGLTYGEDEVIETKTFDIPDAYRTDTGEIAWDNGHITNHPAIAVWIHK